MITKKKMFISLVSSIIAGAVILTSIPAIQVLASPSTKTKHVSKKTAKKKKKHKYKEMVSWKEVEALYDKTKKELKKNKTKRLKYNLDFDSYDLKFTDIDADHENRKAIIWAVENGIIEDKAEPFDPDAPATLEDATLYYWNLRSKYHLDSKKEVKEYYEYFRDYEVNAFRLIDKHPNLTPLTMLAYSASTELAEATMTSSEILFTQNRWDDSPYYEFHKDRYIPEIELSFGDLVALTGTAYWIGVVGDPDYSVELSDRDHSKMFGKYVHDMLLSSSTYTYSIGKEKMAKILNQKKYNVEGLSERSKYFCWGTCGLPRMGYIDSNITKDDIKGWYRKISKGELFQFYYDMCSTFHKTSEGRDFRTFSW